MSLRRAVAGALLAGVVSIAAAGAGGCSFIVDSSSAQCSSDDECASRGGAFAGSICSPQGRCVTSDAGTDAGQPPCTTNQECSNRLGETGLCRRSDHTCQRVLSAECTQTIGDVSNDNAIVLGSIFTIRGNSGPAGIARQNSIAVAVNEISQSVAGVPGGAGGKPRPLAFVACDDTDDSIKPATHLAVDLGLPAIIGVAASTRVVQVATNVTVPAGVLLISPTATSTSITTLIDKNLVWRTAPTDALQAIALEDQVSALETKYRADNSVSSGTKLRMAFVYLNDAYGGGLFQAVSLGGKLNSTGITDPSNNGLVTVSSYEANPTDLNAQVAAVLGASPRPAIIAAFGSTEVITKLMQPVEAQWGTGSPKPMWLFADAAQKTELLSQVSGDDTMRKRVRGSVPAAPVSSPTFKSFILQYTGLFGGPAPSAFGMAGAYDSVFLLAYAAAAAGADTPLTGDVLQKGFARLVPGAGRSLLAVGGAQMNAGFRTLQQPDGAFDIDGASGPLDFDLATGDTKTDIDVWCIAHDATNTDVFVPSGRFYDPAASAGAGGMSGTFDITACQQ